MRITTLPTHQRPREKLLKQGAKALSDAELLAIFFRTGIKGLNAIELAQQVLQQQQSLHALLGASEQEFCQLKGLGMAKYVQLQAAIELSRRYLLEACQQGRVLNSPRTVEQFLKAELKRLPHEVFMVLYVDTQNQLIHHEILFSGTINSASIYPREVVKAALKHNAASVILAHNHPSGVAEPSEADKHITQKLINSLALVDINVIDHLIIAGNHCLSFAERGLL